MKTLWGYTSLLLKKWFSHTLSLLRGLSRCCHETFGDGIARDLLSPFWTLNCKQLICRSESAIFFKRRNWFEGLISGFNKVSTFGSRKITSVLRLGLPKMIENLSTKGYFEVVIKRRINVSHFPPIFEYERKIIPSMRAFLRWLSNRKWRMSDGSECEIF